jgi:ABC-type transporter Mla maintaining outer membrane lipid asymmetry ATPase subunit MlaF
MLYDEPTAGLDPISSIEINNLIHNIKEEFGVSAIIITHDLVCAKTTGDRLLMMFDGVVQKRAHLKRFLILMIRGSKAFTITTLHKNLS